MISSHTHTNTRTAAPPRPLGGLAERSLAKMALALGGIAWLSAGLFGLYILAFYARAMAGGDMDKWNTILSGLHDPSRPAATAGIGVHFAAGGLILLLGAIQLVGPLRRRWPTLHRWVGRLYAGASVLAALGGLVFIATSGTIGGRVMNVGFSLYGVLMLVASIETVRHARAGDFDRHRVWALRLFALAIGSWLYRLQYGFWFTLTGGVGHTQGFDGPFDAVMAFFFYLPNLLVVEILVRADQRARHPAIVWFGAGVLAAGSAVLCVGTYYFVRYYWGPAILEALV